MKNVSSIYLNHNHGLTISESRKSFSILSINKHAYGGAKLVPMAVPEICWMILVSNSKKLFFNINSAISTKSVDRTFLPALFLLISHIKLEDQRCGGCYGIGPQHRQ